MIEHKSNLPTPAKIFLTVFLLFGVFGIAFAISLITTSKMRDKQLEDTIPTAEIKLPERVSTITPIPSPRPTSGAWVDPGCKVSGCSNELCLKAGDELATTACVTKKRYGCYQTANCKLFENGDCDWKMDAKLTSCIQKMDKEDEIFCGGIAGVPCGEGKTCKLDGNYPDAGGVCVDTKKTN